MLVSQFPIDPAKLEAALPSLWRRWDTDQSGSVSKAEFLRAERGLLAKRKGPGVGWSVAEGGKLRLQLAVGSADFLSFFK